jgi:hypothetical protein
MENFLRSGVVGSIEFNAQKKIREDVQNRWEKLGLVDGLQGHIRESVATLFENQAKHLIYEATAADNSGSFETVVFPLIRRVFSKLLANDIVSVQAMNLPIGKLFFIKPVTSERQWEYQDETKISDGDTGRHAGIMGYQRRNRNYDGSEFDPEDKTRRSFEAYGRYALPDEVVQPEQTSEKETKPQVTTYMKKTLYDLFYNDFLFDNSKGRVTIKVGNATPVKIAPDGSYVEAEVADYPVDSQTGSLGAILLQVTGFASYNAGRLTGPDGNEMDSEAFLSSLKVISIADIDGGEDYASFKAGESIHFRVVTQKYGDQTVQYEDICDGKGHMYIEIDLTKPAKKQGVSFNGYIGVDPAAITDIDSQFQIAWAQYDSLELETEMGEVSFQLSHAVVSVEERKLRATWSPELAQDVAAFHNIDAEAELTAILSEQVAAEIDREILRDLRKAAPWKLRWDYNGWQRTAAQSTVYTQKDWNQTLMTKINQISAQVQKASLRGGVNYVVASAEISAVLNDLEYFHVSDASAESDQYNMGIEKIGSLQGRYKVIVDPYSPHWSMILGHQGTSLLDTGYIYAPYVPMALTPTVYNPMNFAPVKGIMTRYAKKLVNNKFYGAIVVDGLVYFNPNELR